MKVIPLERGRNSRFSGLASSRYIGFFVGGKLKKAIPGFRMQWQNRFGTYVPLVLLLFNTVPQLRHLDDTWVLELLNIYG